MGMGPALLYPNVYTTLYRVHSPLLTVSRLIYSLSATKMFQFAEDLIPIFLFYFYGIIHRESF